MSDKLDHLNARQMASENKFHSFQSVWIAANHRPCTFDPDADDDPDPMPAPGRDNRLCLYNIDDLTVQYSVILHVNLDEQIKISPTGVVSTVKPPRHVKWKWLINWAKSAQCNRLFKQLITPYGTFFITNHCIDEVHFPIEQDARLIVKYRCNISINANVKPGTFIDISDNTIVTPDQFALSRGIGNMNHPVWNSFGRGVPEGLKNVKWDNVKDSWRYCYVFDNVLDDDDKKYGRNRDKKFKDAKDMFTFAMYQQFDWWFSHLRQAVDYNIQQGVDRNGKIQVYGQYSNYFNGTPLKDIPDYEEYQKWHFVKGWVHNRFGASDFSVGSRYDRRRMRH